VGFIADTVSLPASGLLNQMREVAIAGIVGPAVLRLVAAYARHAPIEIARWRAENLALRLSRAYGPELGTRRIRTRAGMTMELCLSDWVDQHLYAIGQYEADTVSVVSRLLGPGKTAVDVGANVGFFSLLFGQLVGPAGRVIAFEPQPGVIDRLLRNVRLNPDLPITVDNRAVSDRHGSIEFYCGEATHSGVASLRARADAMATARVTTVPLDDVFGTHEAVDFIKIDVEGAECHAIRGMRRIIQTWSPDVVVEVSDAFLKEMGGSARELCEIMWGHGYRMYRIGWDGLFPLKQWTEGLPRQFNALFTKKDGEALGITGDCL
jgi:FkbM family methyltransferase